MIRCTLELVRASNGESEHLGTIEIGNQVGRSLVTGGKRGDYHYSLFKKRRGRIFRSGKIENFPRLSYHPWNLVRDILNDVAKANGGRL